MSMDSKKRKRLLRRLFKLHNGKCTQCTRDVLIAHEALASGHWVKSEYPGMLRYYKTMEKMSIATIDHIIPSSKGGTDNMDNLTLLCHHCNYVKGNHYVGKYGS